MNCYMTTFTGREVRLDSPDPDTISVVDIAHHLSNLCHWTGACKSFFSIAQHSVLVAKICPPAMRQWGLLHDAAEAYMGDASRPLKTLCPEVRLVEDRLMRVIAVHFGLVWPVPVQLKDFDDQILRLEADHYMPPGIRLRDRAGNPTELPLPNHLIEQADVCSWTPEHAEAKFKQAFAHLFGGRGFRAAAS